MENYVRGTCQTMCPRKEAELRQRENLLHKFEMKRGTECHRLPEFDPARVVKCFNRSAAGKETTNPSNLRPFPVLLKTINYLYQEVFPFHKEKPLYVYNFMFDRFRAIRQDVVIQNLGSLETIKVLEPIVKFLMYFGYLLSDVDVNEFDGHINQSHLQECLKRLLVCYDECRDDEGNTNRWDIESAYTLLNLGNIKPLTRGIHLCETLGVNKTYKTCVELSLQWYLRNYSRVFCMITQLPPLLLCAVSTCLPEIRKYSLQAMAFAYSSANSAYPLSHLFRLLLFETEEELEKECNYFNIKISNGKVNFLKKDFDSAAKSKSGIRLSWVDCKLSNCDINKLLCFGSNKW
ncbi:hypothetical protein RUM44_009070 [Polyplax serrata]|uniref:SAC3/GANP/THP3 conserved domain-containing protein n=1 Tax=Polyplax serrata TaxID=468196 RepID=A0ABR1ARN1_POLSC